MAVKDPANTGEQAGRKWRWIGLASVIAVAVLLFGVTLWASQGGGLPLAGATGAGVTTSTPAPTATVDQEVTESPAAPEPVPTQPAPEQPAPPSEDPASEPPAETPAEVAPLPELPPVPLTEQVAPVPGVVFSIGSLEAVEGQAQGPGEVGGPALRFTLSVRNDSDAPVSMASTVVNVYSGPDELPAGDLREPGGVPLPEAIAPGATVTGVFVFEVPLEERDQVKIGVDYTVGVPIVVFEGAAPR